MSNILLFGDSITFGAWDKEGGWADRIKKAMTQENLAHHFDPYYEVHNVGIPGDTTTRLLTRFEAEIKPRLDEKENRIVIAIGINDSRLLQSKNQHEVPLALFAHNIETIIEKAKQYTDSITFVGLTTIDDIHFNTNPIEKDRIYKNTYAEAYNAILQQIVRKYALPFVDVFPIFSIQMQRVNLFIPDGLHPNSSGHKLLFELILPYIL